MIPLNDAIRQGPEYQEPARDQRGWLLDGSEVVVQCTLSRTAVLRRPDDVASKWLVLLDEVLVDPQRLEWQAIPDANARRSANRGRRIGHRHTVVARKRNLKTCRSCGRDSFQATFHDKVGKSTICTDCEAEQRQARKKPCACGCVELTRYGESYATVACARRQRASQEVTG